MDIIHVDELLFPVGNGSTEPCIGTSNGEQLVIKFINNAEGNKTLVNELVCFYIAKKLELTIPECGLCLIDGQTLINPNIYECTEFNFASCNGIAFYSKLKKNVTKVSSDRQLKCSCNYKWLLPRLLLFDHLIFNKDRNPGNIIIEMSKGDKNLYVIDHTHTFNLECLWNSIGLAQKIEENDFKSFDVLNTNKYLYSKFYKVMDFDLLTMQKECDFFKEKLNDEFFDDIMNNIPIEWEKDKLELKALSDYLKYRLRHIDEFGHMISGFNY